MAINLTALKRVVNDLLDDTVLIYRDVSDVDAKAVFDRSTGLYSVTPSGADDPRLSPGQIVLYEGGGLISTTTQEPRQRGYGDVNRLESPYKLRIPQTEVAIDIHNNDIVRITASESYVGLIGIEFIVKQEYYGTYAATRHLHLTLREHYVDQ